MAVRTKLRQVPLLLVGSLLVACASTALPSPTPGDFTAVLEALALRGATIHEAISGDAGCEVPLHGNAVRLALTLEQDGRDHRVYLFRWRRPADFERAAGAFEECVAEHAGSDAAVELETIELPPWRAYGPDWSSEMRQALEEALRAAGATSQ